MDLEEKIIAYKTLCQQIDELEKKKRELSQEILAEMPSKKMAVAGFRAYRYTRLAIATPLELARTLGATKMQEQVDREKIKELFLLGQTIEGVRNIDYLVVRAAVEKSVETNSE